MITKTVEKPMTIIEALEFMLFGIADEVRRGAKRRCFVARSSYFYTMGWSADKMARAIKAALPAAEIEYVRTRDTAFRGGDTIARGNHWAVGFSLNQD